MSAPRFRIVIATYRRPDDLARCLGALLPQIEACDECHLVIVNDASPSAAYDAVLARHPGDYDYIVLEKNAGPSVARRRGFEGADEDYLICTDDDCIPPPFWLAWIRAHVTASPEIDLFAGSTRSALTKDASAWQRLLNLPMSYPAAHIGQEGLLTAVTACSVMRREAYEAAGGFPSHIRGAAEDCYLTQAILRSGGCYAAPSEITTRHKANTSLREMRKRYRWYGKGGVQTSFAQDNWMLAETGSDGSLRDAWRTAKTRANKTSRAMALDTPKTSWINKVAARFLLWVLFLEYERGWYEGMRQARKEGHTQLPQKPEGFALFS